VAAKKKTAHKKTYAAMRRKGVSKSSATKMAKMAAKKC
jgi:hypothetical protein